MYIWQKQCWTQSVSQPASQSVSQSVSQSASQTVDTKDETWLVTIMSIFSLIPSHSSSSILYFYQHLRYAAFTLITTVKCHYNANASLTRSILGSQTAHTCPHDHPRVAQHMGYRCEIIAVWSATAAMTPLCSHTNGIKQRYPSCWLCQYSQFMIDLRSNALIIHLRCSENAINRPIWLPDARMLKTISVAIKFNISHAK